MILPLALTLLLAACFMVLFLVFTVPFQLCVHEPATETNTHIYQISAPQGLQKALLLFPLHSAAQAPQRHRPIPLAYSQMYIHCSCPKNALQRSRVSARSRGVVKDAAGPTAMQNGEQSFGPQQNLTKSGAWLGNHLAGWVLLNRLALWLAGWLTLWLAMLHKQGQSCAATVSANSTTKTRR